MFRCMRNAGFCFPYDGAPRHASWKCMYKTALSKLTLLAQVVYVHPTDLPGTLVEGLHPAIVDFLADTTRTAASMVGHRILLP